MLSWALTFLVIAIIAAVLGFGGIAGTAVGLAKICFLVFLVLAIVAFVTGRRPSVCVCGHTRGLRNPRRWPDRWQTVRRAPGTR